MDETAKQRRRAHEEHERQQAALRRRFAEHLRQQGLLKPAPRADRAGDPASSKPKRDGRRRSRSDPDAIDAEWSEVPAPETAARASDPAGQVRTRLAAMFDAHESARRDIAHYRQVLVERRGGEDRLTAEDELLLQNMEDVALRAQQRFLED